MRRESGQDPPQCDQRWSSLAAALVDPYRPKSNTPPPKTPIPRQNPTEAHRIPDGSFWTLPSPTTQDRNAIGMARQLALRVRDHNGRCDCDAPPDDSMRSSAPVAAKAASNMLEALRPQRPAGCRRTNSCAEDSATLCATRRCKERRERTACLSPKLDGNNSENTEATK